MLRIMTIACALALVAMTPAASAGPVEDLLDGPPQEPCEPACADLLDLGPPGSDPCRPNCLDDLV